MLQEPMLQPEAMYIISYEFHAHFVSAETILYHRRLSSTTTTSQEGCYSSCKLLPDCV